MEPEALQRTIGAGECRSCHRFCDRVIEPARCLEMGCRYIYSYEDEFFGRIYMGCMQKVFKAEIDVEMLEEAERASPGFGGIKAAGEPLPHCPFVVDSTFDGEGEDYGCCNPTFFDCSSSSRYSYKLFDLRNLPTIT